MPYPTLDDHEEAGAPDDEYKDPADHISSDEEPPDPEEPPEEEEWVDDLPRWGGFIDFPEGVPWSEGL